MSIGAAPEAGFAVTEIVGILSTLTLVVGGMIAAWAQWRKERRAPVVEVRSAEATTASTLIEAATKLVEPLRATIDEQGERIDSLAREVEGLRLDNEGLRCERHRLLEHVSLLEAWVRKHLSAQEVASMPRWESTPGRRHDEP